MVAGIKLCEQPHRPIQMHTEIIWSGQQYTILQLEGEQSNGGESKRFIFLNGICSQGPFLDTIVGF